MSPTHKILSCILILYIFQLVSAASESGFPELPAFRHWTADEDPQPKSAPRLTNPLIGDDRKIYVCLDKYLLIFLSNGTISKTIPLRYTCNVGITPVFGASRKIYLVAENRVLKVNTMKTHFFQTPVDVLLGPETGAEELNEIIGLSISISSSCVLVNIKRRGIFAYKYDGKLRWSTAPIQTRLGYRQGCRNSLTGCFFLSNPVIDHCEANIYVSNNLGELYALSIRSPQFKWIRDLSSLSRSFTISSGNNGQLYVTVPDRSIILSLDVRTGALLWQKRIGPLSTQDSAPVADVNGWISISSLDGFLYSISPSGILTKFPKKGVVDTVMKVNPVLDCSGYAVYISQTKVEGKISQAIDEYTYVSARKQVNTIFTLLVPSRGSVYWSESYPGSLSSLFSGSDLRRYLLDERTFLAFLSISNIGNPLSCFSTSQKLATSCSLMEIKHVSLYTGNEKAITLFLILETILLIIVAALVRFCCVFWRKKKVQKQELGNFLEKRNSLQIQKKEYDRTISDLEKKAEEGTSSNKVIEKLGDLVRERESIEKKLSTSYSFGKDTTSPQSKSLIPLSDNKSGSVSNSCSEESSSNEEVEMRELKGKATMVTEENSSDDEVGLSILQMGGVKILDEGDERKDSGGSMRKRSLSLTKDHLI